MEYELDAAIGCSDLLTAQLAPFISLLPFPSRNTRHQEVLDCHSKAKQSLHMGTTNPDCLGQYFKHWHNLFSASGGKRGTQKAMEAERDAHWPLFQALAFTDSSLGMPSFPLQEEALSFSTTAPFPTSILQKFLLGRSFSQKSHQQTGSAPLLNSHPHLTPSSRATL